MRESIPVSIKTNRWAIVAILCSLCFFILPIVIFGPLLAIIALSDIRRNPQQRGKVLATSALFFGCVVILVYFVGALWWNANVRKPMLYGPANELIAGYQGDYSGFKSGFDGEGASAPDIEVSELIASLKLRYGNFVSSEQMQSEDSSADSDPDLLHPQISYIFEFERKQVPALADFLVIDLSQRDFVGKFKWVIIQDDELGDLVYPASAEQAIRNYVENLEQQDNGN